MPATIPDENHFSLNGAAKRLGIEQQEFRKTFVKEFERQVGQLPIRFDENDQQLKVIPGDFLHIFEEANLWARLDAMSVSEGMARALHARRSGALEQLAVAVRDRQPLLLLPRVLREETAALVKAANSRPVVTVKILDQDEVAGHLSTVTWKVGAIMWVLAVLAGVVLLLGAGGVIWTGHTDGQLRQMLAQQTATQAKLLHQLQQLQKKR